MLIGGATTSRAHTAIKISPHYFTIDHPVIHVLDASRSVPVVSSLLNTDKKRDFVEDIQDLYEEIRIDYENEELPTLPFDNCYDKRLKIDWVNDPPVKAPNFLVKKIIKPTINDIKDFIDWSPFFQIWNLRGKYPNRGYPKIFNDETVGKEAKELFDNAQKFLETFDVEPRGIIGLYEAYSDGHDVFIKTDEKTDEKTDHIKFSQLRQQTGNNKIFLSQSDFIAPKNTKDHIGLFACGVFGAESYIKKYDDENDDYNKIMTQSIADRLAEALAEYIHFKIRTEYWGFSNESKDIQNILKINYQGIRPAPGYPSQPDHTEKLIFGMY